MTMEGKHLQVKSDVALVVASSESKQTKFRCLAANANIYINFRTLQLPRQPTHTSFSSPSYYPSDIASFGSLLTGIHSVVGIASGKHDH